jgi:hypothetical protein
MLQHSSQSNDPQNVDKNSNMLTAAAGGNAVSLRVRLNHVPLLNDRAPPRCDGPRFHGPSGTQLSKS